MFRRNPVPLARDGACAPVADTPDVRQAIDLLDEVEEWLAVNGAAIAHAAIRPWSRDAVGWQQCLHAVHEELVEQSTRLTQSSNRETNHLLQEDTHALLARMDRIGGRQLVRDQTVDQLIPWFLPTQLVTSEP